MVVALIALTGLGTLGTITMLSVEGGVTAAAADRSHAIALMAAESGAMVGMNYLTEPNYAYGLPERFSYVTRLNNVGFETLPGLPGNRRQPGQSGNMFSPSMKAWYDVVVLNNWSDPRLNVGDEADNLEDSDGRILFRSTGYGPNRATATIEAEVEYIPATKRFAILSWREVE